METSGKKKSKKGRNKRIKYIYIRNSNNPGGAALSPEKKSVRTEDQDSKKHQEVKREKPQPVVEEKKKKPQPVNPWKTNIQEGSNLAYSQVHDEDEYPALPRQCFRKGQMRQETGEVVELKGPQLIQPERPSTPQEPDPATACQEPDHAAAPQEPDPATACQEPEPAVAPQEPEHVTAPQEPHPIITKLLADLGLTVTEAQQPACPLKRTSVEVYCEQTNQALLPIPELELQRMAGEKEEQLSKLAKEKRVLLKEVTQFKQLLKSRTTEANIQQGLLQTQLSKERQANSEASHKIGQLENAVEAEKKEREEMEMVLAQKMDVMGRMEATLAQSKEDLQLKTYQWEEDRSRLLEKQQEEISHLLPALKKAKEELENERRQWKEEKSLLLESLRKNNETLEEKERASGGLTDLSDLENQMDEIKTEEQEPKKTKKKSLWKRFRQLFK